MAVAMRRLGRTFGPRWILSATPPATGLNRRRLEEPMGEWTHARDVRGSQKLGHHGESNAFDHMSGVRREPLACGRMCAMPRVRLLALRVIRRDPQGFQWKRSDLNSRIVLASVEGRLKSI